MSLELARKMSRHYVYIYPRALKLDIPACAQKLSMVGMQPRRYPRAPRHLHRNGAALRSTLFTPRARALFPSRDPISRRASCSRDTREEPEILAPGTWSIVADRPAVSREPRDFSLSLIPASDRYLIAAERERRESAESRRVFSVPTTAHNRYFASRKKREKQKRIGEREREIILSLGVAEAPFLYNRRGRTTTIYPGVADR